MGVSVEKAFEALSTADKALVDERAADEIKAYKSLQDFRRSIGMTQEEMAGKLKVKQTNISQFEARHDMNISTLRRYVEALGGTLEINIHLPGTGTIHLEKLHK